MGWFRTFTAVVVSTLAAASFAATDPTEPQKKVPHPDDRPVFPAEFGCGADIDRLEAHATGRELGADLRALGIAVTAEDLAMLSMMASDPEMLEFSRREIVKKYAEADFRRLALEAKLAESMSAAFFATFANESAKVAPPGEDPVGRARRLARQVAMAMYEASKDRMGDYILNHYGDPDLVTGDTIKLVGELKILMTLFMAAHLAMENQLRNAVSGLQQIEQASALQVLKALLQVPEGVMARVPGTSHGQAQSLLGSNPIYKEKEGSVPTETFAAAAGLIAHPKLPHAFREHLKAHVAFLNRYRMPPTEVFVLFIGKVDALLRHIE